ncbi:MAG: GAF domain-containing protein [Magnetococcus sp. XQGC-1]
MPSLPPYLLRLLLLLIAACAGWLVDVVNVWDSEGDQLTLLRGRVAEAAKELSAQTVSGQMMGLAMLLGVNEPILKQAALGELPADAPEVLRRIGAATQLIKTDGIYVINDKGVVVAHDTQRISFTGRNLSFRPYWQQAIAGQRSVYAAVGTTSDERGMYVAAPLYATEKMSSAVIGVVVIKFLADHLDDKLASLGSHALLLSPQSVVFASSVKSWLYQMGEEPTPERVAAIVKLKQFGKLFEQSTITRLPIPLEQSFFDLNGVRHAIVQSDVDWVDPSGMWKLVVLQDTRPWLPLAQRLAVDLLTGMGLFLYMSFALLQRKARRDEQHNRETLEQIHQQLERHASRLEEVVQERTRALTNERGKLDRLVQGGINLSSERDETRLLDSILTGAMEISGADGGILYVRTGENFLAVSIVRANSLGIYLGGAGGKSVPFPKLPLYDPKSGQPNLSHIALQVVHSRVPINVPDVYTFPEQDYPVIRRFDKMTGYHSQSLLLVPLWARGSDVVGVLQLLNAHDAHNAKLIVPFSAELQAFVEALAAQAAIAIDNQNLISAQRQLISTFEKFVPKQFLQRIAGEGLANIKPGTVELSTITVMFSDIRSFTTLSEQMAPSHLFALLNSYLSRMQIPIEEQHGFIDKFIGDAIMALFDGTDAEQATRAVRAAIGMQQHLLVFNAERTALGQAPIRTGIGLHIGQVMLGTLGNEHRMDSTVIGDAVNLSARLEGLTKFYGCRIVISEDLFNLLASGAFSCRPLDRVVVKGRTQPILVYDLFDADPEPEKSRKQETLATYQRGFDLFYERRWPESQQAFRTCLAQNAEDLAAQMYLERCATLLANPPGAEWDGTFAMHHK